MNNIIAELRKNNGFSQEELASMLNISRPHLSDLENGKSEPGGKIVIELCRLFQMDARDIFFDHSVT